MSDSARHVKLFRNGRNQAVRIPVEFELPGTEAVMRRVDGRLIIEAKRKPGLLALIDSWTGAGEDMPEVVDPPIRAQDVF